MLLIEQFRLNPKIVNKRSWSTQNSFKSSAIFRDSTIKSFETSYCKRNFMRFLKRKKTLKGPFFFQNKFFHFTNFSFFFNFVVLIFYFIVAMLYKVVEKKIFFYA